MFKTFYYFQQNILKDYTAQLHFNLFPTFSNPYVSEQLVTVASAGFLGSEGSDTALMYVIYVLLLLCSCGVDTVFSGPTISCSVQGRCWCDMQTFWNSEFMYFEKRTIKTLDISVSCIRNLRTEPKHSLNLTHFLVRGFTIFYRHLQTRENHCPFNFSVIC